MTAATILLAACSEDSQPGVIGVDATVDRGPDVITAYDTGNEDARRGCGLVTCESAGATCGPIGDGCGGILNCGTCASPQTCGGGGMPSRCGGTSGCVPRTCAMAGANCGPVSDGCGGLLECGACAAGQSCGGGGRPSVCGSSTVAFDASTICVRRTCAMAGANCGPVSDGCGGGARVRHLRGSADLRRRRNARPVWRHRALRSAHLRGPRRELRPGLGWVRRAAHVRDVPCGADLRRRRSRERVRRGRRDDLCSADVRGPRRELRPGLGWMRRAAHVRDVPCGTDLRRRRSRERVRFGRISRRGERAFRAPARASA
ncbi:MAG: hypothetical protein U0326_12045 [Polyangiales bacterium]